MSRVLTAVLLPVLLLLSLVLNLGGCQLVGKKSQRPPASAVSSDQLTQEEARLRREQVKDVDYEVYLDISSPENTFSGRVSAHISLNRKDKPLRMDFHGGEVTRLIINSTELRPQYDDHFITLQPQYLKAGENIVEIEYRHAYSEDGMGLYRFKDPQDGEQYVYSNFQPYAANRMFPHFDQPDLKASYKLTVRAPSNWEVVSSAQEKQVIKEGSRSWWYFPPTQRFSSYAFSLHAGPFKVWRDDDFRYPLRLMTRKSQEDKADPDVWFQITRQGFDYFEQYFDIPYPYRKFDQLLVPDFYTGAMENVAAVTYHENMMSSSLDTNEQQVQAAHTILHELSHMWFGNLVTMTWWDGLWLNESFANYMAFQAMAEGTDLQDAWLYFFQQIKQEAYHFDTLPTTHPIKVTVADTHQASANFDSIAYTKGPAALKQLRYRLGDEAFRQGIRDYLQQNIEGNTRSSDFIHALESASGQSLKDWVQNWLNTSGVNSIKAEFQCKEGYLSKLTLHQTAPAPGDPLVRTHYLNLGLYRVKNQHIELNRSIPVIIDSKKTKVSITGKHPCPAFVYPNAGDQDYIRVQLDNSSQTTALNNAIADPLLEAMVQEDLLREVKQGNLKLTTYLESLYPKLRSEERLETSQAIQHKMVSVYSLLQRINGSLKKPSPLLTNALLDIESFSWDQLMIAEPDSELQTSWYITFVRVVHSAEGLKKLDELYDQKRVISGLKLKEANYWGMLLVLNEYSYPGSREKALKLKAQDHSSHGQDVFFHIETIRPQLQNKRDWINRFLTADDRESLELAGKLNADLFTTSQSPQADQLAEFALSGLALIDDRELPVQYSYAHLVIPSSCKESGVQKLEKALNTYKNNRVFTEALTMKLERARNCLRVKKTLMAP